MRIDYQLQISTNDNIEINYIINLIFEMSIIIYGKFIFDEFIISQ